MYVSSDIDESLRRHFPQVPTSTAAVLFDTDKNGWSAVRNSAVSMYTDGYLKAESQYKAALDGYKMALASKQETTVNIKYESFFTRLFYRTKVTT